MKESKILDYEDCTNIHKLVKKNYSTWIWTWPNGRIGSVQFGSIRFESQIGRWSKRVIFKRVNRVAGQTGHGLSRVASRVKLTRIFQTNFFFFFKVDAICQLFMSSLIVIRFSLVILLPITIKHLT